MFSCPRRPYQFSGPTSLISNGYRRPFPGGKRLGRELTSQLVSRSRKSGSIHPLPHKPSWYSASLVKHRYKFPFYLLKSWIKTLRNAQFLQQVDRLAGAETSPTHVSCGWYWVVLQAEALHYRHEDVTLVHC
jgi:hypothetical protein